MTHPHLLTFIVCTILIGNLSLDAEVTRASQEETKPDQPEASLVDETHQNISVGLITASQWFDNFFDDPRVDEEPAGTLVRLRGAATRTEGEGMSYKGRVRARLELPNLKQRYHLIVSSEDDDLNLQTEGSSEAAERITAENEQTSVALQYTKRVLDSFVYSHRVSIRYDNGLNPRFRTRARYTQQLADKSMLNLTQVLFWEYRDGLGQENRIDLDHSLQDNMLTRTTAKGVFSEVSNGYEWLAMQQVLFAFSKKRAITMGAYIVGETSPKNYLTDYALFIDYRQKFLKEWLFYEILPAIHWPRENNFSSVSSITVTLEVRFGG